MAKRFTARPRVGGRRAVVRTDDGVVVVLVRAPWVRGRPLMGGRSRPPPGGGRVVDW